MKISAKTKETKTSLGETGKERIDLIIKQVIEQLVILEQHQVCFARNLFPRPGQKSNKRIFSADESLFLFFIFNSLHNVPELTIHLLELKEESSIGICNKFLVKLVQSDLVQFLNLIKPEECKKLFGIKHSNTISSWIHCEFKQLSKNVELTLELLSEFLILLSEKYEKLISKFNEANK